jgi:Leucine-rich repeat (LRR) protein
MDRHLALSTNSIEKISSLSGMDNLRILSLGRNLIKKIENLDAVADTLEELWMSYNQLEKLVSLMRTCRAMQPAEHWCTECTCTLCISLTTVNTLARWSPWCHKLCQQVNTLHDSCTGSRFGCHLQAGAEKLVNLRVFYLSNNKIKDWAEVERLAPLEKLEELLLVGNTLYNDYRDANDIPTYRIEVRGWMNTAAMPCQPTCTRLVALIQCIICEVHTRSPVLGAGWCYSWALLTAGAEAAPSAQEDRRHPD